MRRKQELGFRRAHWAGSVRAAYLPATERLRVAEASLTPLFRATQ